MRMSRKARSGACASTCFQPTTADATSPLNADRTLLYRFNLGYLNTESFRDFWITSLWPQR